MLIVNARIYTMEGEPIQNGWLRTEGSAIAALGEGTTQPMDGEEVFDARGGILMPGMIDAHCHVGMWDECIGFEGADGNESTDVATPQMRSIDGVNVLDVAFQDAREAGITTVVTGPGSANPIGGQFVALKTAGNRVDDMIVKFPVAMKFAMGENPKRVHFQGHKRAPQTRMATAAIIREQLRLASDYMKAREGEKKPDYNAKYEALIPVLKGELQANFHAHRADDIFTAIRIAKEFGLKYAIVHCTEGHLIADQLKEEGVRAIVGPTLSNRSKPELSNLTFRTPGVLSETGLLVALDTDHPVIPIQYLPLCAALSVKHGMPYMDALKAITINPAVLHGIDNRVGSLREGKDADLLVFDRDPLDVMASPRLVMISGRRIV